MSRVTRIVLVALAVAAVAVLAVVGLAGSHQQSSGRPAPALPTKELAGRPTTIAQLTSGRSALVVFWASWCGPCQQEAPAYAHVAAGAGRGRIVGVDWSDVESDARAFVRRYGWSFPNYSDGDGSVGEAYRIINLPTTFVIGPGGGIRAVLRGPQNEAALLRALASAERQT